jgi:hypothetical protein
MVSVKCNSWAMVSMWEKCMVQFMYHVNNWKDVKKSLTVIVCMKLNATLISTLTICNYQKKKRFKLYL